MENVKVGYESIHIKMNPDIKENKKAGTPKISRYMFRKMT